MPSFSRNFSGAETMVGGELKLSRFQIPELLFIASLSRGVPCVSSRRTHSPPGRPEMGSAFFVYLRALIIQKTGGVVRPPAAFLGTVSFFAALRLKDCDPRLRVVGPIIQSCTGSLCRWVRAK